MNLKTKKIIAKEFLILLLCLGIAVIFFLSFYPYNAFKRKQVKTLGDEIGVKMNIADSLSKAYKEKSKAQFDFTEKYASTFDLSKENGALNEKLWTRLNSIAKNDSIKYKWENKWSKELIAFHNDRGFRTPESFQAFILRTIINSKDFSNYKLSQPKYEEIAAMQSQGYVLLSEIVPFENQLQTTLYVLCGAFVMFYGLRYLFYGIRWSLKTLKQN